MKKTFILASTALLICAASASAHHGTSAHFDHDKDITVEGVVSEMKFVNPHSYLFFDVPAADGTAVPWRCEMVEAGTLRRAGMTDELLAPGTIVRVYGKPARREDAVCYLETITLPDGLTISHRGQISEGEDGFTPSATLQSMSVTPTDKTGIILATGGNEAANRKIVEVPTEGMFGHWALGNRSALAANGRTRGQGQAMGGNAGGGMGTGGMGTGGMGAGGMARNAAGAGGTTRQTGATGRNPIPQYNEVGLALAERYDASYDNPALACSASVLFGISHHSLPNEFVQLSDSELRLTYGYMDMVRTIHLGGDFPANITPSTSGYSVGEWDGDTLVITTKGFRPDVLFAFAGAGNGLSTINSDQLVVTERIRHDEAADTLTLNWKAEDTGYWTAPLEGEKVLNRSIPYEVYGCEELAGENNVRESGIGLFDIEPASGNASPTTSNNASPMTASGKSTTLTYVIGGGLVLILGLLAGWKYRRSTKQDV